MGMDASSEVRGGCSAANRAPEQQRYTASYRAISSEDAVKVYNGAGCVGVARAMSFDTMDPAFSSVDMAAAAILSDVLLCIRDEFARCHEDVMDLEGRGLLHVDNPLAALDVRGIDGVPTISSIDLDIYLFTFLDEHDAREVIDRALLRGVLYQSLTRAFPINLRVSFAE